MQLRLETFRLLLASTKMTRDYRRRPRQWEKTAVGLRTERESDPLGVPGNPMRELHAPLALAAVHSQDNGRLSRRIISGGFNEKEIRTHLCDADRFAVDDQLHLDLCRMGTVILLRDHERNSDS